MTGSPRILIVDDEPLFLRTTAALLEKAGYDCHSAPHAEAAIEALEKGGFDLIVSDLNMPGNFDLELLKRSREDWPEIPLIVVTGAPSLPTAVESLRLGIVDYLQKPVKYEDLLESIRRASSRRTHVPVGATRRAGGRVDDVQEVLGNSPVMVALRDMIQRSADSDTSVLITGESGTGKEVVASAIHRQSRRASGPFQIIDCTAIPESLFESILFGHVKGAFTGAIRDQPGLLSQADGGTVFLDEIGELPATLQSKLLRLIQSQTFTPVGMATERQVDVRFISATNRDLQVEVQEGRFRSDLYYRLAVLHIETPPLRERGDDIMLLAEYYLNRLAGDGPPIVGFNQESRELMLKYHWPGNVRELRNAVERGRAMCRGPMIAPEDLPRTLRGPAAGPIDPPETGQTAAARAASRQDTIVEAERQYLITLLKENKGNIAQSARVAEISRQSLHRLIRKHNVDSSLYR